MAASNQDLAIASVVSRFFINLPAQELKSFQRIFIQLEQAFWFYDDFFCDQNGQLERFSEMQAKCFESALVMLW